MPQGDKSSYSSKQKRQARHIEESEQRRGRSPRTSARIAWATVNKQDGGGKRTGKGDKGKRSSRSRRASGRRPTRKRSARSASHRRTRTVRSRA
jgi:hypothetical protein